MLSVKNVRVQYGNFVAVDGASLIVENGEITALVGANGMGKSTLIKAIMGLNTVSGGTIEFEGEEIQNLRPFKIAEKGITLVPEGRGIFSTLTVEDNLDIGAYTTLARKKAKETKEFVFNLFPILRSRRKQQAGTLSGGEQQMLAIGRALMACPKLCMLDEVSLGLAPKIVDKIYQTIAQLRNKGITILLTDQFLEKCAKIAERIYVMESGKIVWEGTKDSLDVNAIKKKYFGIA